jgi:N-carbamoyl-L-amino-acid hydrolase
VLAAIEAVEAIVQSGRKPRRSIEIVVWMNEEGSRFAPGMMGSVAFSGDRVLDAILAVKDADGVPVGEALDGVKRMLDAVAVRALGAPLAAYAEAGAGAKTRSSAWSAAFRVSARSGYA